MVASVPITRMSPVFERAARLVGSGLDHAQHRHRRRRMNFSQGERARRIAGDHQKIRALVEQKAGARERIAHDGRAGFRPIGQPRRVAQVEKLRLRKQRQQRAQHGQAAETGIEYANLQTAASHRCFTPGESEAR